MLKGLKQGFSDGYYGTIDRHTNVLNKVIDDAVQEGRKQALNLN
ncbi:MULTISPECIES: hypothetical protein [unclassified Lactobacillus]|nr:MULTISPECIES: hypothetical protein [unclassified Lactobacillus]